jgi:hypothetical protein
VRRAEKGGVGKVFLRNWERWWISFHGEGSRDMSSRQSNDGSQATGMG